VSGALPPDILLSIINLFSLQILFSENAFFLCSLSFIRLSKRPGFPALTFCFVTLFFFLCKFFFQKMHFFFAASKMHFCAPIKIEGARVLQKIYFVKIKIDIDVIFLPLAM
jgi:hypothetical protein